MLPGYFGVVVVDGELGDVVLGVVLGEVVELDEPLPMLPELLLPEDDGVVLDVPPPELEPDLLKYASHSVRDTEPSLLVSTAEKLGADELLLALEPPEDMLPDAPLDEVPDADGVVVELVDGVVAELLPEAEPEAPDDEDGVDDEDDGLEDEPVAEGDDDGDDED